MNKCIRIMTYSVVSFCTISPLKGAFHGPTNRTDERHKTADLLHFEKIFTDLLSLPTNIDDLSIVLYSPIRH